MSGRIEMHSYWFGASRFVALVMWVNCLLLTLRMSAICCVALIQISRFTNILLAIVLAVNTMNHIFSTTCEDQDASFESLAPAVCMRTHTD